MIKQNLAVKMKLGAALGLATHLEGINDLDDINQVYTNAIDDIDV